MDPEKEAINEYLEEGVELPPDVKVEAEKEETPEEAQTEEEAAPIEETPEEPLQPEPQPEPKKRSIYRDLKDTRNEVKTERELREQAEKERDDLRRKLEEQSKGDIPDSNDIEAFAEEIGADPSAIKRMRELFLKDLPKSELSPELASQLEKFQEWQSKNSKAVEQVAFEQEFKTALPSLNKMFAKATPEEIDTIKTKLQELAHTEAYRDKELDYIAFKNQTELSALVSPKKRGLESKGRTDVPEGETFTFDPNADLSKMSDKQVEEWQKTYDKATAGDSLHTDSDGRRIII